MTTAAGRPMGGARRSKWLVWLLGGGFAGFLLGLVVDLVWPNVAYGYQVVAGLAGLVLVLLAIPLWHRRRQLALLSLAGGAGVLLGIAVGLALQPGSKAGTATVDIALEEPEIATLRSTNGVCLVVDDRLVLLESTDGLALVDGRSISVTLSRGRYRPAPDASAGDALTVDVRVQSVLDDGSPTETWMGSDTTSMVTVTGTAATGTVDFSHLVLRPLSEQHDPIDVAGSISWSCEPAS